MMPIEHANVLPQVFRNYFSPCCFNCRFGDCFNCRFGYGLSCRFGYHLDNSRFAIPLGQSGNMLSPWAHNFVDRWQTLKYIEINGTRAETARTAIGTITLSPPVR